MSEWRLFDRVQFSAVNALWNGCVRLYARGKCADEPRWSLVQPIALRQMSEEDSNVDPDPFLVLRTEHAQELMDVLWNCGIRPSDGTGSVGQLAATQTHLEDMRVLAFHSLGAKKPGSL